MVWLKIALIIGIVLYYIYKKCVSVKAKKDNENLEALKNSLLAFALMKCRRKDFDDFNMKYGSFNGTKLPMMSGCSLSNACFSYIITKEDFRNGPWYSRGMEEKIDAIEKYLRNNFDTSKKVESFFDEFIRVIQATPSNDTDVVGTDTESIDEPLTKTNKDNDIKETDDVADAIDDIEITDAQPQLQERFKSD